MADMVDDDEFMDFEEDNWPSDIGKRVIQGQLWDEEW